MPTLFGSVADDFNDSADDTFTGLAKMTPDFRKYDPVMCRIDENAIADAFIFNLPFKNRKKNSLYMRELDSVQQVICKMHKCAAGFYADIRNFRLFRKSSENSTFYPYIFEEKVPLL